jgi:hypothetical protein
LFKYTIDCAYAGYTIAPPKYGITPQGQAQSDTSQLLLSTLRVLADRIDTVKAMAKGMVTNDGSPEYGGEISQFMLRIAALIT